MKVVNSFLVSLYSLNRWSIRNFVLKVVKKIDGGEHHSSILREIFKTYHGVDIGLYTHGGCFKPGSFDKNTIIGAYSSIATTARAFNRNHPIEFKSSHAFFFNPKLGYCKNNIVEYLPLEIGNDVWLGHNSIIFPNVKRIGDGAVVAAGAIVNKDLPPYSVVVGNPARIVKYRFDKDTIDFLIKSKWWEKSIDNLKGELNEFQEFKNRIMIS